MRPTLTFTPPLLRAAVMACALVGLTTSCEFTSNKEEAMKKNEVPAMQREMKMKIFALSDSVPLKDRPEAIAVGKSESYSCVVNLAMVNTLLVKKNDLVDFALNLKIKSINGASADAALEFRRLLKDASAPLPQDAATEPPFLALPLQSLKVGDNLIAFKKPLENWLNGTWENHGFLITVHGGDAVAKVAPFAFDFSREQKLSHFLLTFTSPPNEQIFAEDIIPRQGVYAQAVDGKLCYGGKRLKLWGVCRHESENLLTADRVRKLGYNAIRIWGPACTGGWDEASIKKGEMPKTTPNIDVYDRFFAECKNKGLFVMFPGMLYTKHSPALLADDSFLRGAGDGDGDWEEWKKAFGEFKKAGLNEQFLIYFDERYRDFHFRHMRGVLDHVNPYTGTRYAEEEAICMYEINNENGFLQWTLGADRIEKFPPYFKTRLQRRWSAWLKERYASDDGVKKAWGAVRDGESLAAGYALAPTAAEAEKSPKKRGDDFVEFMTGLVIAFNADAVELCRNAAPKGVGSNVVPILSDTQFLKNIPWLYANAAKSDAVSFGVYQFTLSSSLTKPPSCYILDHLTVKDKVTFIYEFNVGRPNPYRAEWCYKIALLASWEDWDGVFFHYFSEPNRHSKKTEDDLTHEEYLVSRQLTPRPADVAISSSAAGDNAFSDAVDIAKQSAFSLAGRIFTSMAVTPAKNRTTYSVGPAGYYSYNYIRGIAELTAATTFSKGAAITFDAHQTEPLKIIGDRAADKIVGPVTWNEGDVVWDWENGRVIIDAPSVKAYIGKPATYRFRDGITLSGIDTPFVAFGMTTEDGSPILKAGKDTRILVSAVYDSQNIGFEINTGNFPDGGPFIHPNDQGKMTKNIGLPPSSLTPVPFLLSFPKQFNGRFDAYDYALRRMASHEITKNNSLDFLSGQAYFMSTLFVDKWGATSLPRIVEAKKAAPVTAGAAVKRSSVGFWSLVPLIDWNMNYLLAHQMIRDGSIPFANISKCDYTPSKMKSITVTEFALVQGATANVSLAFTDDALTRVDVEFVKPPVYAEFVAHLKKSIGVAPVKEETVTTAATASSVDWVVKDAKSGHTMFAAVKEMQGVISASFEVK